MPRVVRAGGKQGRLATTQRLSKVSGYAPSGFGNTKLAPKFELKLNGVSMLNKMFRKMYVSSDTEIAKAMERVTKRLVFKVKEMLISGEYKAYQSGKLYRSIKRQVEIITENLIYAVVGSFGVEYAVYVHEGTSKRGAKPFLTAVLEKEFNSIVKTLTKAIENDIIGKSGGGHGHGGGCH